MPVQMSQAAPLDAQAGKESSATHRPLVPSMLRGFARRCPKCAAKTLFSGYLSVPERCTSCGESFANHRADDAPPYFTIFIVGHIVVSLLLTVEVTFAPPIWLHLAIWLPLTLALCLLLLPSVKGATIALQWAL